MNCGMSDRGNALATFSGTAPEWDELADRVGASPFVRPGWILAWWRSFGRGALEVLSVRGDGRLTGVLPVVHLGSTLRSPTNSHTPLFGILAQDEQSVRQLAEAVYSKRPQRLDMSYLVHSDTGFAELVEGARSSGMRLITRSIALSPYVNTAGGWSSYERTLDGKRLRELRRRRKRLEERGRLSLEVADGSERLESLLDEGFRLEGSDWKTAYGTAIDSRPETRHFYSEVAAWAARRGWLRLAFLRLDGDAIAFDYCLESAGDHYLLKTGYASGARQFSPGSLLRYMMLQRAFSDGLRTYEFLGTMVGSKNSWKLDWTNAYKERVRLQAFAPSAIGSIDCARFAFGVPLAQRARDLAGRVLGPRSRHLVKRGWHVWRSVLRR
jgi:CelD/BcsL family acetyltransferase involved in cellulose biosynthesis